MDRSLVAILMHFDLPFRFLRGHAVTVDQDSLDDITNCVEAVLRTLKGQRTELPDFGLDDPAFQLQPINLQAITNAVLAQEPRASMLLDQAPDQFNYLIAKVLAQVSSQEVSSA